MILHFIILVKELQKNLFDFVIKNCKYHLFLLASIICFHSGAEAQNITITPGPDRIALNEAFTITLSVQNERLSGYDGFPEIEGFLKRGTSSSTSTRIINGQATTSQSITQNYVAQREGVYSLEPFTMTVNGKKISSPGKKITVGPPKEQRRSTFDPFGSDPFEDLFGRRNAPQEFIDVEADAFLALSTSKDEVFVGEGFNVTLAFYVAETNRAQLQFFDLGSQLAEILKKLRPANCWEENFNIESIQSVPVVLNGKRYQQYKIYQATFYPLNLEPVKFPSVGLKLIKYQVSKQPSFFGRNTKEDYKTFYTKSKTVTVKDLPPHPLKDQVSVGDYKLSESIDKNETTTGNGFNYTMSIRGEGNISAIDNPETKTGKNFEFYDPNVQLNINRSNGKVTGEKSFEYFVVPKEPGTYELGNYLKWIFFNPNSAQYDTLQSDITLNVSGESLKNDFISSSALGGGIYDQINEKENKLQSRSEYDLVKIIANVFIVIMLILTGWLVFKK